MKNSSSSIFSPTVPSEHSSNYCIFPQEITIKVKKWKEDTHSTMKEQQPNSDNIIK